jgi:hypothetical protein
MLQQEVKIWQSQIQIMFVLFVSLETLETRVVSWVAEDSPNLRIVLNIVFTPVSKSRV